MFRNIRTSYLFLKFVRDFACVNWLMALLALTTWDSSLVYPISVAEKRSGWFVILIDMDFLGLLPIDRASHVTSDLYNTFSFLSLHESLATFRFYIIWHSRYLLCLCFVEPFAISSNPLISMHYRLKSNLYSFFSFFLYWAELFSFHQVSQVCFTTSPFTTLSVQLIFLSLLDIHISKGWKTSPIFDQNVA